jgi:hypothetical protein
MATSKLPSEIASLGPVELAEKYGLKWIEKAVNTDKGATVLCKDAQVLTLSGQAGDIDLLRKHVGDEMFKEFFQGSMTFVITQTNKYRTAMQKDAGLARSAQKQRELALATLNGVKVSSQSFPYPLRDPADGNVYGYVASMAVQGEFYKRLWETRDIGKSIVGLADVQLTETGIKLLAAGPAVEAAAEETVEVQ